MVKLIWKNLQNHFYLLCFILMFVLLINLYMRRKTPVTRKSISPAQFRNFIFAGRSVFTLENSSTGNYITFRIKSIKKQGKVVPNEYGVEAKVLGDSSSGYTFMGFLNLNRGTFQEWGSTQRGSISYVTFYWLMRNIGKLEDFNTLSIYHEGSCCKCGMPLTVPESIDSGIGPECKKKMLGGSITILKNENLWDAKLSYEDNVKAALFKKPRMWNQVFIPDDMRLQKEFKAHHILDRFGVLG